MKRKSFKNPSIPDVGTIFHNNRVHVTFSSVVKKWWKTWETIPQVKKRKGKKSGAEAISFFSQFLSSVMGFKHDGNTKDAQSHRITSLRCVGVNSPNHITATAAAAAATVAACAAAANEHNRRVKSRIIIPTSSLPSSVSLLFSLSGSLALWLTYAWWQCILSFLSFSLRSLQSLLLPADVYPDKWQ